MRKTILFGLLFITMITLQGQESVEKTTTYFLIRHAEKERTNPADKNPDLNERGFQRAENWKKVLQHVSFDVIYSTNFIRTLKTAEPIAKKFNLEPITYNPSKVDFDLFQTENKGKNVLIVGHSNTIPQFVNGLIKQQKYQEMDDAEFSHLYIVTIKGNQVTDLL
ncbi:MAG: phosphoglycerate mutase family protein, partial [Lutibacter sp.]|nr:phosphoglycerate mutase family protein [Lutibacter sp.]